MEEVIINYVDKIYMWPNEKPSSDYFDSYIGRILLTNYRFIFLSTGINGVQKQLTLQLLFGPITGLILGQTKTKDLDLSALQNKGSLNIDLKDILSFEVKRTSMLAIYSSLTTQNFIGEEAHFSFSSQWGLKRKWLDKFKEDLMKAKEKIGNV